MSQPNSTSPKCAKCGHAAHGGRCPYIGQFSYCDCDCVESGAQVAPSPTPQRLTPARLREIAYHLYCYCSCSAGQCSECETVAELRAHAAYLETQGWQDIATAPKDGEWILLHYDPDHTPCIAFWGSDSRSWLIAGGGSMPASKPKMWANLPKPPEAR